MVNVRLTNQDALKIFSILPCYFEISEKYCENCFFQKKLMLTFGMICILISYLENTEIVNAMCCFIFFSLQKYPTGHNLHLKNSGSCCD